MKTIFVLGNELLKEDSLPLKIKEKLAKEFPEIKFREFDPTEEFPEKKLVFLDSVLGIKKVSLIKDLNKIDAGKNSCSVHNFDLSLTLKLLKKIGKITEFELIGIPSDLTEKKAFNEVKEIIQTLI